MKKPIHFPFLISVFGGVFLWFLIFLIFPAKVVYPFSNEAFGFIFISYCSLILGYFVPLKFLNNKEGNSTKFSKSFICIIICISIISFIIRYIDLFCYRKISFSNGVWLNRELLTKTKPMIIFIIASVFKQFYFIPLILILKEKIKDNKLIILTSMLFLFPFIEGFIRGSRNMFFIPIILLFVILLFFKKIRFKKKHIIFSLSITVILFTIATSIIMSREADKTDYNYSTLTTNSYLNEFLKPNPGVFKKIHSIENQPIKKSLVSGFQISQYYVHGVFEFDNLVKFYKNKPHKLTLGKYTFFTLNRFTNKYGITNTDLEKIQLLHPRGYTFITFFGGLFLDFGWYGVIIMFLYGMFQRYSYNQILINKNEFLPLFIFLLFVNFFMLTFNYLRGLGIYIILVCFLLIFVINFNKKIIFK